MKTLLLAALILSVTSSAVAQDKVLVLPQDTITVKAPTAPCTERPLDQGRGKVRTCG